MSVAVPRVQAAGEGEAGIELRLVMLVGIGSPRGHQHHDAHLGAVGGRQEGRHHVYDPRGGAHRFLKEGRKGRERGRGGGYVL